MGRASKSGATRVTRAHRGGAGRPGRLIRAAARQPAATRGAPGGLKAEAVPLTGSPAALAEALLAFAAEGISHVQVELQSNSLAEVEAFASVLQALDRR